MKKSELATLKPCLNPNFNSPPPHRRRPLQSQTYRTFVRILSHCNALQTSPNPRSEDGHGGDKLEQVGKNTVNESSMEVESSLVQQMSPIIIDGAKDVKLGEIGNRIVNDSVMEVGSSLIQQTSSVYVAKDASKDVGSVVLSNGNALHVIGSSKEEIEELTQGDNVKASNSMLSNLSTVTENQNKLSSRIEENVFGRSLVTEVSEAAKQPICLGLVAETPNCKLSPRGEQNVLSRPFVNEAYEVASQTTRMFVVSDMPEPFRSHNEKNLASVGDLSEGLEHQLQLKQSELEELISASDNLDLPVHNFHYEQIEEGEISVGNGVDDKAIEMLFEDDVSLEGKKVDKVLASEVDELVLVNDNDGDRRVGKYNDKSSPLMDHVEGSNDIMEPGRSNREEQDTNLKISRENVTLNHADGYDYNLETGWLTKHVGSVKESNHPVISSQNLAQRGQITYEDITENKSSATAPMEVNIAKKRRRGPLTEERKAKKKKKERIKRAKKNEELGVKRLKLQPVLKTKKVEYCRHYLKGRCQQGEKCEFSHDTIPETKSTPCSYFARQSCMKGDNCPFDHQLSKYPCNNWATKGSCNRGTDCLFKHEVSSKNEASLVSHLPKPENNSTVPPPIRNCKNQVNKGGITDQQSNAKLPTKNYSIGKVSENEVLKTLERSIADVPKGISISSISQMMSPIGNTSRHGGASPYHRADNCVTTSSSMANLSGSVPVKPPKGINFLVSGKSPTGDSAIEKKGASGSVLKNGVLGSFPSSYGGVKTGNQVGTKCSELASEGNKRPMEVSPVSTPQGIKCLPIDSITLTSASAVGQKSSSPDNVNSGQGCIQGDQNLLEGLRHSSRTANGSVSSSPHPPWQSLNQCAGNLRGNSSSSPKASGVLNKPEYVLGFAAKVESEIKLNRPSGNPFSLSRQS